MCKTAKKEVTNIIALVNNGRNTPLHFLKIGMHVPDDSHLNSLVEQYPVIISKTILKTKSNLSLFIDE